MARKTKRAKLKLSAEQKCKLGRLSTSRKAPLREVLRSQILLHYADEIPISQIQQLVNVSRPTIYKCIDKALAAGADAGLKDYSHRPFGPTIDDAAKTWAINYKHIVSFILIIFIMTGNNGCKKYLHETLSRMPEYDEDNVTRNHEWFNEEKVEILGYSDDAMEIGISPDGKYLLFNDRNEHDKDMHWSTRIDDRFFRYQGKVRNTVSKKVDGTPSFDAKGNIYFTTLKNYPDSNKSIYSARFRDGAAIDPVPVNGNIYVKLRERPKQYWVSLDPDISDDGRFLFYSEGRFIPGVGFPYPFNVRGAVKIDDAYIKIDDQILKEINTDNLEYAPAISSDGLEIFFSRIGKVNGRPKMVGIFTARRKSINDPFSKPEKIMAITGNVEAPVLSGDENELYYHRMEHGVFKVYRVSRKRR